MELVEVKCVNCSRKIYILKEYIRENMFCTLGCMDIYMKSAHVPRLNC